MTDVLTAEQRRFNMSQIKCRNTKPEMFVRSMVHRMGYRFRLHRRNLPGKPDLVFPRLKKIIFVHGCFFHMHRCRYGSVIPKTNYDFWRTKRLSNLQRDKLNVEALESTGWQVLIVWECQVKHDKNLSGSIKQFLGQSAGCIRTDDLRPNSI